MIKKEKVPVICAVRLNKEDSVHNNYKVKKFLNINYKSIRIKYKKKNKNEEVS